MHYRLPSWAIYVDQAVKISMHWITKMCFSSVNTEFVVIWREIYISMINETYFLKNELEKFRLPRYEMFTHLVLL